MQDLAIQTADSVGSMVILATDPDADRLALAEKDPKTGKWNIFSGNETGTLLSWWAFKNYKDSHPKFDGEKSIPFFTLKAGSQNACTSAYQPLL